MKMAGHWCPVPPVQGLLLCILALHLCVQDPLATAEHNAVTSNTSVAMAAATSHTWVAINKASVSTAIAASKTTATAAKKTLVATTKTSAAMAAATNKTSVASAAATNKILVTNKAMVTTKATAATTASVAITKASVPTAAAANNALVDANKPSVAVASATNKALVAVAATTSKASVDANRSSVAMATATSDALVGTNRSSVAMAATNNAPVAANASVNGTEETPLICQSFQCSRERCYQDEAHANATVTCHNETYCELYRFSSTNYTAKCSSTCSGEMCRTNSSVSTQQCALDCCNSSLCLRLNASSYGDLPPTTVPSTTTSTTRAPPRNGKVCAAFSCHGDRCFKGKKTVAKCFVGHDFCEMKKTGLNYVAGCSKACKAAKPVCAGGMKAACYQECCPATPKASCLKLDGKVHVNSAGQVTLAPLLKLMVFGVVLLNYRVSASLWV